MNFKSQKLLLISVLIFLGFVIFWGQYFLKNFNFVNLLSNKNFLDLINKINIDESKKDIFKILPSLAGIDKPRNYLILFLNNTELRPGGGFIGAYAVLNVDKGKIKIVEMTGSENLDQQAVELEENLPIPLANYLQPTVKYWYFRDANWSPDFGLSAQKALELWLKEKGKIDYNIDAVIGVTTDVLVDLLKITGEIRVKDINFSADNVIKELEWFVEYDYKNRGIDKKERKQIIAEFLTKLIKHIEDDIKDNFNNYNKYISLLNKSLDYKNLIFYSQDKIFKKLIVDYNIGGKIIDSDFDYLMWVDANLSSLKTDLALKRVLKYKIEKIGHQYIATAEMTYKHNNKIDWRTSYYRDYLRIYTPLGSKLINITSVDEKGKITEIKEYNQGIEMNKTWFGIFTVIKPQSRKTISFQYLLPFTEFDLNNKKEYYLLIQKQIGLNNLDLVVILDLDLENKNIDHYILNDYKDDLGQVEIKNNVFSYQNKNLKIDKFFRLVFN